MPRIPAAAEAPVAGSGIANIQDSLLPCVLHETGAYVNANLLDHGVADTLVSSARHPEKALAGGWPCSPAGRYSLRLLLSRG
jgi:hypothetical protein